MAYTQADLDAVQKAKLDLSLGKRVSSVYVDGDRVEFTDVPDAWQRLCDMESLIRSSLGKASFVPRTYGRPVGRFR